MTGRDKIARRADLQHVLSARVTLTHWYSYDYDGFPRPEDKDTTVLSVLECEAWYQLSLLCSPGAVCVPCTTSACELRSYEIWRPLVVTMRLREVTRHPKAEAARLWKSYTGQAPRIGR